MLIYGIPAVVRNEWSPAGRVTDVGEVGVIRVSSGQNHAAITYISPDKHSQLLADTILKAIVVNQRATHQR